MARRNNLKSVAHNFGHSFLSLMNWSNGHYIEDFLLSILIAYNHTTFHLDIKNHTARPEFVTQFDPIAKSIHHYCTRFFPQNLASHGFSLEGTVMEATMIVEYDFATIIKTENFICASYKAVITLVDERAKKYTKAIESYTKVSVHEYENICNMFISKEV